MNFPTKVLIFFVYLYHVNYAFNIPFKETLQRRVSMGERADKIANYSLKVMSKIPVTGHIIGLATYHVLDDKKEGKKIMYDANKNVDLGGAAIGAIVGGVAGPGGALAGAAAGAGFGGIVESGLDNLLDATLDSSA